MKKIVTMLTLVSLFFVSNAQAAEVLFNPSMQFYDMNGNGILSLWGISTSGAAVKANPDFGYPTELAIASWYATILKAQEMGLSVVIGYDPVSLEIWYIAKPR